MLIAGALLPPSAECDHLIDLIAWSNLYKVNTVVKRSVNGRVTEQYEIPKSAPCAGSNSECDCMKCNSLRWLGREVDILQPDVIVFGIGPEWARLRGHWDAHCPERLTGKVRDLLRSHHEPASAWLTYHFSAWAMEIRHGGVILDIRKDLTWLR